MPHAGGEDTARVSVESESDVLSTIPAIETPSSTPSAVSSPQVELVNMDDDDSDFANQDPPLAIIDDQYIDIMYSFPYRSREESALSASQRVASFLQQGMQSKPTPRILLTSADDVPTPDCFYKLREWMNLYLSSANTLDTFYDWFLRDRDFWRQFPDFIWGLSQRRLVCLPLLLCNIH